MSFFSLFIVSFLKSHIGSTIIWDIIVLAGKWPTEKSLSQIQKAVTLFWYKKQIKWLLMKSQYVTPLKFVSWEKWGWLLRTLHQRRIELLTEPKSSVNSNKSHEVIYVTCFLYPVGRNASLWLDYNFRLDNVHRHLMIIFISSYLEFAFML